MQSVAERLASLSAEDRGKILSQFSADEAEVLLHDWRGFHARPDQIAPDGDWDIWLALAGRGWGKTRTGAEWVRENVENGTASRIALVAETAADARDVMVAELIRIFPKDKAPLFTKSARRIDFHNGAKAWTYNATEPDQLRGPQHDLAWCFVAGTLVSTPGGDVPIETLGAGDTVLTRFGPRAVLANGSRKCVVGRVVFENGKELVGTADHPVYLSHGWTRMDQLRKGDEACAIAASSGTERPGIVTAMGAGPTTKELESGTVGKRQFAFTGRSGATIEGKSRRVGRSITATVTWQTMTSAIWNVCRRVNTPAFTALKRLSSGPIGSLSRCGNALVRIAEQRFFGRSSVLCFAGPARSSGPKAAGRNPGPAKIAAAHSEAGKETSVVSVASTWQRMGEQEVFCLKVDGAPEYFANGILVHNCDELAKWRYARETWDMLQFGLRLGDHPRQMVTTTPRPIELIKAIIAQQEGKAVVTRGRTMDNRANLAPSFLERIEKRYGGTRLGRQELNAEILSDLPGALWSQQAIDGYRVPPPKTGKDWRDVMRDDMERIVVAVDPAITAGEESDEHGIVVAGIKDHVGYVLEDGSLSGSPVDWARRAVSLSTTWGADGVVIEVNQGGDMVAHTLRTVAPNLNIIEVRASRGKHVRAEPIAALYEQGRARHVGQFPELEAQMTQMTQEGYEGDDSPDRLDAMVWALTELFPDMVEKIPDAAKVSPIRKGLRAVSRGWMGG